MPLRLFFGKPEVGAEVIVGGTRDEDVMNDGSNNDVYVPEENLGVLLELLEGVKYVAVVDLEAPIT